MPEADGLDQVVVEAGVAGAPEVILSAVPGERRQRRVCVARGAQPRGDRVAVHPRQPDLQQHQVRRRRGRRGHGSGAVVRQRHLVAGQPQEQPERLRPEAPAKAVIDNGGFTYFASGPHAISDSAQAFEALGLGALADACRQVIGLFPNQTEPADRKQRLRVLRQYADEGRLASIEDRPGRKRSAGPGRVGNPLGSDLGAGRCFFDYGIGPSSQGGGVMRSCK